MQTLLASRMHTIVELSPAALASSRQTMAGQATTPVGLAWLVWDETGLRELAFGGPPDQGVLPMVDVQGAVARDDAKAQCLAKRAFSERSLDLPLVLCGTEFQCAVWRLLLQIGLGQTVSYGELAQRLGKPSASRAVGSAVGANRLGFVVPCHRVVRQDGMIGQFRWGSELKRRLLEWELDRCHG